MTGDSSPQSAHPIKDPGAMPRPEGPIIDVEPVRAEAKAEAAAQAGPVPPKAPSPKTNKTLPSWTGLAVLGLLVAIGLAFLIFVPWGKRGPGDTAQSQIADGLDARLKALENKPADTTSATLESRLAALEEASQKAAANPLAPLSDVETLRTRVDALETQLTQAQAQRVALTARLDALQAGDTTHTAQSALLALAASALDDSVHMGRGFRDELSLLQRLAPGDDTLTKLEPFADDGIEPVDKIAQAFPAYARDAQDAIRATEAPPQGIWANVMKFLSGFVTVRDEGVARNAPVGETLNAMNMAAVQGDLAKAVALKAALPVPAQTALAPWVARAQMHLSALDAATQLRQRVIAQLAKATLAQPTPEPVETAPSEPAPARPQSHTVIIQ